MEKQTLEEAFGFTPKQPYFEAGKMWASPHNFSPEVRKHFSLPERVFIHDVTLRDGEQTPGVAFTPREKVHLALMLDRLGVHSIEPGLPATPEDREVIKTLMELRPRARIVPLIRIKEEDVSAAIEMGCDGMLLEFGINPYLLKHVYRITPEILIQQITQFARAGKEKGMYIEFMGWDAFRVEDWYLRDFFQAIAPHVDRVTISDTFGMGHPLATFQLVSNLRSWTGKPVGFHIHNDFGLALAGSLMAITAGADMVHTSINGLGERAGNVATEELALSLEYLMAVPTGIDLSQLASVSAAFAEASKVALAQNKPVVGRRLFDVESGIVVHILQELEKTALGGNAIFPYPPTMVGREPYQVQYGRGSGKNSIRMLLERLEPGLQNVSEEILDKITQRVKEAGLVLKSLLPASILQQIVREALAEASPDAASKEPR